MKTKKSKTNKKTTTAKKAAAAKAAPKYTRLDCEDIGEIMVKAATLFADYSLYDEVSDAFEVEEYEEAAGTFFIQYRAQSWRDAEKFNAAIIGSAFMLGHYAEPSAKWEDGLEDDDGFRLVSVFVTAANFMSDDGHPVA